MKPFTRLAAKHRSRESNQDLGRVLAFVAGYINAGGFFIVQQYTSHMTGILSIAADNIALGQYALCFLMLGFIACFVAGACTTTIIVLSARKHHLRSQYALPLLLEALLIALIAMLHPAFAQTALATPITIATLCFLMGLQNALITKVSTAIIRTTHVTGMTTDLGIEIGRSLIVRKERNAVAEHKKAGLHLSMIITFFSGGVLGAIMLANTGSLGLLPVMLLLLTIGIPPLVKDLQISRRLQSRRDAVASLP